MKKNAWFLGMTLILIIALILPACSGASNSANTNSTANKSNQETPKDKPSGNTNEPKEPVKQLERKNIKIGLPAATAATFAPLYLAETKGFYKDEGLDVQVVAMQGNNASMQALASKSVDMVFSSLSALITTINANQPFVAFWGNNNAPEFYFYSKTLKTMNEAKGARFGISSFGGITETVTRAALGKSGIDPFKGAELLVVGESAAKLAALDAKQIDVAVITPPFNYEADEKGLNLIYKQYDINPTWPSKVIFGHKSFVKENPESIKAFLRALHRAIDSMEQNPEQAANELIKRFKYDEKYALLGVKEVIPGYPKNGEIDKSGLKVFWDLTISTGEVKEVWPDDKWLDKSFLDTADKWLRK